MRNSFWKWAGWLGVGLAGCLHSQDGRQVLTRPVADRRDSLRPITFGPRQLKREPTKSSVTSIRDQKVGADTAKKRHEVARDPLPVAREDLQLRQDAQAPPTKSVPPSAPAAEPVAMPAQPMPLPEPGRFVPPPTTPGNPSTSTVRSSESRPFAEFERAIPLRSTSNASGSPTNLTVTQSPGADKVESLFSPSAEKSSVLRQTQELTAVPNEIATNRPNELTPRSRDVAQLVEQVFENLRQHRLTEARERTEQLKQLVARSSTGASKDATADNPAQPAKDSVDHPASMQLPENTHELPIDNADAATQSTDSTEIEPIFDDEELTHE